MSCGRAFLLSVILGGAVSCSLLPKDEPCSVTVTDLRCEYLVDPLGIDEREPRLSWRLEARNPDLRGLRQTSYHLLVASGPSELAEDRGDLWDSGEVASNRSVHVVYAGKPLGSGISCWWKIRVRDQAGRMSPWSPPARWTMGLLEAADWKGRWIGNGESYVKPPQAPEDWTRPADPWFRRTFELQAAPRHAMVYLTSVGYHELWVNGRRVGDAVLSPAVADHTKRARYVTYDVTKLLRPGQNAIGVWLGPSWSIYPLYKTDDRPTSPIFMAQAVIELANGEPQTVASDATWMTHASPSTLIGQWNFMNFGGELYDASKEMPDWCTAELDDSGWSPVTEYSPALELSAEMVEPNRLLEEIRPVAVAEAEGGAWRVDMGVNFTGWVELDVSGEPGTKVEILFSEQPEKLLTHRLRSAYIIGPSGRGTFRNRFNYSVGRWITIQGLTTEPSLDSIRGWLVRTDFDRVASFECSEPLLNEIYETTLWTFENLSLGGYVVDCAQRERMGYGGDAHATTETGLSNYRLGAFYTKWAEDWRDVQGKEAAWGLGRKAGEDGSGTKAVDGNLPYTAPTYWGGGGPGWSGYCVTLPWLLYRYLADERILQRSSRTIERWLAFLESQSKDNLLVRWGGEWDFLGDWLWPGAQGVNGDTPETLFFNNCYWVYNLQTGARIAEVIGNTDAAEAWSSRAEEVRQAIHAKFYNPDDASYVNGFQAYLAIALLVGIPPDELRPAVWKRLEKEILEVRGGHFWGGITGGSFVVKALIEHSRHDLMYPMVSKTDYPSWGDMLAKGATAMWESWEGGDLSRMHSSYLHVGAWFIQGVAGIRPDPEVPGFQAFVLRPGTPPGCALEWAQALYECPYGVIASGWRIEDGRLRIRVEVPPNTTATLYVPTSDPSTVTEGGVPAGEAVGVRRIEGEADAGTAILRLESGSYSLEAQP